MDASSAEETFTEDQLSDPLFRLGYWDGSEKYPCPTSPNYRPSIYTIRNKFGQEERFVPNPAQCKLLKRLFIDGIRVLIVPKARQRGMSTLFVLIILDCLIWSVNVQTTLIDFNGQNAKKKLDEKAVFAYKRLPAAIQAMTVVRTLNRQTGEFTVGPNPELAGVELGKQTSTGFFGDQPRGGTNQLVLISEWAEIAARFPQRSADIRAGVLATANTGIIIIETTWHGGKRGDVYTFVKQALETPPEFRTKRTPWLEFFAWWGDPDNIEEGPKAAIRPDTLTYFREIKQKWPEELAGVEFTDAQMLWYQQTKTQQGIYMNGQHPTVLAECFQSIIKGAVWAEAISKMRQEGRITNVPHDPSLEVDTFWDLGAPDNTAIKFVQHVGSMHHVLSSQQGGWSQVAELVRGLKSRGYTYGTHYLPHDGARSGYGGVSFEQQFSEELARQGCSGKITVIDRCKTPRDGIIHMTGLFQRCLVDSSCAGENGFIEAAEAYRWREDPRDDERFLDEIVKDWTSHDCLDGNTLIHTNRGHIPLRKVTVNDRVVLGSIEAPITFVGPTKFAPCIEFIFSDGTSLIGHAEHKSFSKTGLVTLDSMSIGDEIWTPHHPIFSHLTNSPLGARKAFTDLFSATNTSFGPSGECITDWWTANKSSSIVTSTLPAILPRASNGRLSAWVIGKISRLQTGLADLVALVRPLETAVASMPSLTSMEGVILANQPDTTATNKTRSAFTGQCGSITVAKYQMGMTCIIKTGTKTITTSQILSFLREAVTCAIMEQQTLGLSEAERQTFCGIRPFNARLLLGTLRRKALNGIAKTASGLWQAVRWLNACVSAAKRNTSRNGQQSANSVPPDANSASRVIVAIRHLPPRQLYDMTVPLHHCYVANGVLVSNCDSIRMMAEADMLGYLPGTGNAVATKPYFDPGVLKDASKEAAARPPHLFSITNASGNIIRQVTATPDASGWLRIWQEPSRSARHLVTVLGRSMQVWRADGQDGLMALCAAPPWVQQLDFATLYRWAALASAHYGLAPIAIDILSHPGGVRALQGFGAPILARQQLDGKRPIGQEEPTQHPGWEYKPEVAQHALSTMQGRIRQSRMILNCSSLIQQCSEFTNNLDGLPDVREGVSVDAANCAALACLCHDLAGPFRSIFVAETGGHNVGIPGAGSSKIRRR